MNEIIILSLVASAMASMGQVAKTDIAIEGAAECGFEKREAYGADGTIILDYTRVSDKTDAEVKAFILPAARSVERGWRTWTFTQEYNPNRPATLSGVPLGDRAVADAKGILMFQHGMVGKNLATVVMTCYQPGAMKRSADHWSARDRELMEGGVRHALARMAGRSLETSGNTTVNSRTITGMMRTDGGIRMAPLDAWAEAHNIALNRNALAGTASFSLQGKSVILALACDKAKVSAQWRDIGGFLLRRGATWYVPLDGIEAAIGG